jgi:CLIP-associating protein 1/2
MILTRIILSLDPKQQRLLLEDPANPRPQKEPEVSAAPPGVKPHTFSKSTNSLPPKPSIRETIAAQKRAKMSGKVLPERPGSAEPSATPMKPAAFSNVTRPATAMSTIGSLSSAPVRPMRPPRRPEMKRPVTADHPPNKKPVRLSPNKSVEMDKSPSSYKKSPQTSPVKKADTHAKRVPDVSCDKHHDFIASKVKDLSVTDSKEHPLINRTTLPNDVSPAGDILPPEEAEPESAQRISETPRAIASKKESLASRLKVYEDPVGRGSESPAPSQIVSRPSVLEELPINEPPIYQPQLSPNYPLLAEESESPLYHRKWINIEAGTRRVSDSDKTDNPYLMRRMLESGIVRIKAGTLDAHGFRKLQALIRGQEDIWEHGVKFDELLLPLLGNLESPNVDYSKRGFGRGQDLKTQVLMTIRLLQQHQPSHFSAHYSRALCAIILARQHYNSTSHMVCGLEETSETIVAQCDPLPSVDAVLDLLEVEPHDDSDTLFMSLYVLAGLLHRVSSNPDSRGESTISHQNVRLGNVAARCLRSTNPDVRRGVVEFVLELHDAVKDKARFWSLIDGVGEDHRSLITYYLARREKTYGRTELTRGGTAAI